MKWADHYAAVYHVPSELVDSIIEVESAWNPRAVSTKGAVGLMQLMPATAATFGVTNRFDIEQNIRGGVAYLARLLKLFDGDLRLVAAAYLTGENRILPVGLGYSHADVYLYVLKVARLPREAIEAPARKSFRGKQTGRRLSAMTVKQWRFWTLPWILSLLDSWGIAQGQTAVQPQIQPQVVGRPIRAGQVTTVFLVPRYVTAVRMPEPINSVVVGDPASFSAEHSDREPNLVFVKPITAKAAQTNLLISSTRGLQASLLLISRGEPKDEGQPAVDFLMRYKPAGQFMIQPADSPSVVIPQTVTVGSTATVRSASGLSVPIVPASSTARGGSTERPALPPLPMAADSTKEARAALDDLLDRQRRAPLPVLYGQKPGVSPPGKELVKTGVGEVIDQGSEVVVLFSAVNVQDHAVELMPPQIQLGGMKKSGKIIRKSRWSTAEQLPVMDFRMSRRRLGPGERSDGVVVFQRPSFKQSTETLFLQMAESGAVDRPALAPIGFGISSFREVTYDAR